MCVLKGHRDLDRRQAALLPGEPRTPLRAYARVIWSSYQHEVNDKWQWKWVGFRGMRIQSLEKGKKSHLVVREVQGAAERESSKTQIETVHLAVNIHYFKDAFPRVSSVFTVVVIQIDQ